MFKTFSTMRVFLTFLFITATCAFVTAQDLKEQLVNDICACYQTIFDSPDDFQIDQKARKCREDAIGGNREAIMELAGSDNDRVLMMKGRELVGESYDQLFKSCPKAVSLHERLIDLNLKGQEENRSASVIDAEIAKMTAELANSKNIRVYLMRSLLYAEKGDFKSALKDIDTSLEQVPTNQHFLLLSALLNDKLDQPKAAQKALDTLLENSPKYEDGLILKALLDNR